MKGSLIALAIAGLNIAGLSCFPLALPAAAQDKGVWIHPSGAYQLDYGGVGWKIGELFSYRGQPALVTFEPRNGTRAGSCVIFESRLNYPPGVDQVRANAYISNYTAEKWATAGGYEPARVQHFANEMVGDVRVATMIVGGLKPTPVRAHYRGFVIIKPDGAFLQELSCKISPTAPPADLNAISQFLASLRFDVPAAQDLKQQQAACSNANRQNAFDLIVGACTQLIQSGWLNTPDMATALTNRSIGYAGQKDYTRAIADSNEAIRLNPNFALAFYSRGNVYRSQEDFTHAIADYGEAIRLNPQIASIFNNRGIAYYGQKDYAHAIADYSEAVRLNPQHAEAFRNRGLAYERQEDYVHAIADYSEAIRLNPQDTNALFDRGLNYLRRGAFQPAFDDFDAAMRANADLVDALYGRGIARLRLGQTALGNADIAAATSRDAHIVAEFAEHGISP